MSRIRQNYEAGLSWIILRQSLFVENVHWLLWKWLLVNLIFHYSVAVGGSEIIL